LPGGGASVQAAILAGGEGKRFRPYTELLPKPMVPLGPEERPLLEYILRWISRRGGVKSFVFLLGYRWKQVRNYFDWGDRWGVEIEYSVDEEPYSGTGGALARALDTGKLRAPTILVWYGDIVAPLDVAALLREHAASRAAATIAVADRYKVPVGVAEVAPDGSVTRLREKPWVDLKATIGILALDLDALRRAREALGTRFDVMEHMIPWLIEGGHTVRAFIHRGPWYDVGSWERYQKFDPEEFREFLNA